jgi:hypothetical protein
MNLNESNFGVTILCPDLNSGGLKYTTNSIKATFPSIDRICMVGSNAKTIDITYLSNICQIKKAGKTITSLIDDGICSLNKEWCLVVMAGSIIRYNIFKKYKYFAEDKDILFPVIDKKFLFPEASINGILMRKETYEDVGKFGDSVEDIREAKLIWAAKALEKGYKLKGIVGARFL